MSSIFTDNSAALTFGIVDTVFADGTNTYNFVFHSYLPDGSNSNSFV